jgi:N-acyl-D-amino-acid deacylase
MPLSLVIRNGTVFDGTGAEGRRADVGVDGDRVAVIGAVPDSADADVLDATGMAVSPGFINILSHAWGTLQVDGSGSSDVYQGVTTEIFGEAFSLGPSVPALAEATEQFGSLVLEAQVDFPRLSDGLNHLERQGVGPNVASFVGGTNLRVLGAGLTDGPMSAAELDRVRGVLAEEMADGALGVGTALIYAPGRYASTDELVALCEVVAQYNGLYISHMRSEGDQFLECLDELLTIGERSGARTEVYHLKAAGRANWPKMKLAIERIEQARQSGRAVAANMYPYTAGGTSLAAAIPPSFHDGGTRILQQRLADPATRKQVASEITSQTTEWENLFVGSGGGAGILLLSDLDDGTPTAGRWLSDVAVDLGLEPVDALIEIVQRDISIGAAYFLIDESNVRLGLSQPWVSVGSDATTSRPEQPWTSSAVHPRTYGTFARVLGHYRRDEGLFSLAEAIRRMTSLPAGTLRLTDRGTLLPGSYADIAVFDPATIADTATWEQQHSYAVGMKHVCVNGVPVLRDGALTEATPGRHLRRG